MGVITVIYGNKSFGDHQSLPNEIIHNNIAYGPKGSSRQEIQIFYDIHRGAPTKQKGGSRPDTGVFAFVSKK